MQKSHSIYRSALIVLGVTVTLITLTYVFHRKVYAMLAADRGNHLVDVTEQLSNSYEQTLANIIEYLHGVASLAGSENRADDWDDVNNALRESGYRFLQSGVVDLNGRGVLGPNMPLGQYGGIREAFRGYAQLTVIHEGALAHEGRFLFAVPVKTGGSIRHALYGILDRKQLAALLNDIPVSVRSWSFVTDADHQTLLPINNLKIWTQLQEWLAHPDKYGIDASLQSMKDKVRRYRRGIEKFEVDNHTFFIIVVPMRTRGWLFHTLVSGDEMNEQAQSVITLFIMVFGALLLLFVMVLIYIQVADAKYRSGMFRLAYVDRLTDMPNWEKMQEDLKQFFSHRPDKPMALVSLDVKNFKLVNEMFGYARGDELLRHIGSNLAPDRDLVHLACRLENDCFVLLATDAPEGRLGEKLHRKLNDISSAADFRNLHTKFSCGVCPIPPEGPHDWTSYVNASKMARETLHRVSETAVAFYDNKMKARLVEAQQLRADLEEGLQNGDFLMYLQPKFGIAYPGMEKLVGAEALVRWRHKSRGLLPPSAFIPIFEEDGSIEKLDRYIFSQACQCIAHWVRERRMPLSISVNLSRVQLSNPNLSAELAAIADEYQAPRKLIDIELTESAAFGDMDALLKAMHSLKEYGFKLSLDDFGTGYSSLSVLRDMPMDVLKLDKSFIDPWQNGAGDPKGLQFVKDIVTMADNLGIQTISEGVETQEQVELLRRVGCVIVQGYFFGKPMPREEFEKLLESAAGTRMFCLLQERPRYIPGSHTTINPRRKAP